MKAKRFLALILALVMALSLVACGDSGKTPAADGDGDSSFPKMTWTAATSGAEGSNFDVGLEKFSELLQEKTNGAVKLDIYCSDQLTNGNQADSIQANIDGTIDVTFQADGVWGNFDTVFSIPNLPFLFDRMRTSTSSAWASAKTASAISPTASTLSRLLTICTI